MSHPFDHFKITEETEIEIEEGELTIEEKQWLRSNGILSVSSYKNNTGEANEVTLDVGKLAQLAFEHSILTEVASAIEVEIMETFRTSDDRTLTTAEITEQVDRPKSSVSRALTRLAETGKITKVQPGVYRY